MSYMVLAKASNVMSQQIVSQAEFLDKIGIQAN